MLSAKCSVHNCTRLKPSSASVLFYIITMPVSDFYRFDFVNRSEARLLATSLLLSLIRLVTWFPAAAAGPLVVPVKRCVGFVSDFKETVGRIHPCRSA